MDYSSNDCYMNFEYISPLLVSHYEEQVNLISPFVPESTLFLRHHSITDHELPMLSHHSTVYHKSTMSSQNFVINSSLSDVYSEPLKNDSNMIQSPTPLISEISEPISENLDEIKTSPVITEVTQQLSEENEVTIRKLHHEIQKLKRELLEKEKHIEKLYILLQNCRKFD